ncbi:DUF1799 domain-containing protein [uncultured Cohaesibacter sp.]|uniref:DUF1799 domain-containing protein n=1 Tax=uncultured Cohaesibacter sp. TaxID=1002546 RepID=UPI0029C7F0A7|nr:DUF1799 domain-containing protein [uncultured Cohaesibacter sp.]
MGVSVEVTETPEDEAFDIMAKNKDSMLAWLNVETQWKVIASMAGLIWIGLNYTAVDVALRRLSFPDAVFDDLLVMEKAALPILNGGA